MTSQVEYDFRIKEIGAYAHFSTCGITPVSFSFQNNSFKVERILSRKSGPLKEILPEPGQSDMFTKPESSIEFIDENSEAFWVKTNNGVYEIALVVSKMKWYLIGLYAGGKYHLQPR